MLIKIKSFLAVAAFCLWGSNLHAQPAHAPLRLGQVDIAAAAIHYQNPLSGAQLDAEQTRALVASLYQTQLVNQAQINQALQLKAFRTLLTTRFNLYLCSERIDTNLLASQPAALKAWLVTWLRSLTRLSSHRTQHTQIC